MLRRLTMGLIFGVIFCSQARAGECVNYGPSAVAVTGKIYKQTFFGPPNYGENPDTDSKETFLFIALDKPICVTADGDQEAENDVKIMQMLYLSDNPFQQIWLGQHVSVSGTLFHADTGHHHTPVLITVTETRVFANSI